MKRAILIRTREELTQTLGHLLLLDDRGKIIFSCVTLELPWRNNKRSISCIPTGTYNCVPRTYGKYANKAYHVFNKGHREVKGRSSILIHSGNTYEHTRGCILIGKSFKDINEDNIVDVIDSRKTLTELQKLTDSFELKIINYDQV